MMKPVFGALRQALPLVSRRSGSGRLAAASRFFNPEIRTHAGCSSNVDELFVNNHAWRLKELEKDPQIFERLKDGQQPRYLWIGCSDSRVPAESVCGLPPGSLFVHRNIANVVNNVDTSCMSVIQYAVDVLKVEHIVICGHYGCGGCNAAMLNTDHGSPLENWLRNIRDVYRLHQTELDAIPDIAQRQRRMVELNVVEQVINLFKTRVVQRRRTETSQDLDLHGFTQPRVHPVVFDPATGKIQRLDDDYKALLRDLVPIYNLYHAVADDDMAEFEGMGPSMVLP
jgi:carbonic anhydrase